jgi:glyoxylate/hydroxypyruvate reductase A
MALLLQPLFGDAETWKALLTTAMPEIDVRIWPETGNPTDIDVVAVAALPPGAMAKLPNLRLIISLTAGTDGLLRDPDLPSVPIVRAGDPAGDAMMSETTLLHALRHHRNMPDYLRAQQQCKWIKMPIKAASERTVGVMGLGSIGLAAAKMLVSIGFKVAGWVRHPRPLHDFDIFAGRDRLDAFLARSEILVNLLPLTPETDGIINADLLNALPAGAAMINLGRGDHVVESDLLSALDSGHLSAATLDVFPVEPLPSDSPLWRHPKITIMPHVARRLVPEDLAPRICAIVKQFRAGSLFSQTVDRKLGY